MAFFQRASPALKEILLKLYRADRPLEIDHRLHEFGAVEYHIQSSAADSDDTYLSISTPLVSRGVRPSNGLLPRYTIDMVKRISPAVVEVVEPAKEGYQLTLRLNLAQIPHRKDSVKIITEISSVQSVILSSQLKEILLNVNAEEITQGMYKPIKIVYHPREPFFVIKQPAKITAVFPVRLKEKTDVIIATAFFQELMDVGSSATFTKAPPCIWSPIPPPELRGELIEDLSTNGGFVSFEITSKHVKGKKLDKTVWNLLNFYALVKYHVKSSRGFIQRRMRTRLDSLVEVLYKTGAEEDQHIEKVQGCTRLRKLVSLSKTKILRQRSNLINKIKKIRSKIKILGFSRFRRKWLTIPKFSSARGYTKLE